MTVVSINQPYYLPWLAYFDRIKRSDVHVVLDHVQLEKGGYTNRSRFRHRAGNWGWLTIPVEKGKPINETRYSNRHWVTTHINTIAQTYNDGNRGFRKYWYDVAVPLATDTGLLIDILTESRIRLLRALRIKTPVRVSSEMGGAALGRKSDLILNLCQEVGATQYLSGAQGRNYLDAAGFKRAGVEIVYHEFPGDMPILDYLFNARSASWPQPHPTSEASSPASAEAALAAHPQA